MKFQSLLVIILSINCVNAEIILDGTLGTSGALSGSDYLIEANLGQQYGGNLFHSFQKFNLQSFESAIFSGPDSVTNIFARVTGDNPSNIDGTIRSTISNANFYFLNPYGIVFGENAQLDIQGSFHASTADYLRFSDGGRFDVQQPNNSALTVAPIEAFGFLTKTPAPLSIEGSQLTVPVAQTLSFIGGNLILNHAKLKASMGQINLASIASLDEIIPTYDDFVVPTLQGDITMSNQSLIDVSGEGSGRVFIRGGQFFADNSKIKARTFGDKDGGIIDMQFNNILLINGSSISSQTNGAGDAGTLLIKANQISIKENVEISVTTNGTGNAGTISVEGNQIILENSSKIFTETYNEGHAGTIKLQANQLLKLTGPGEYGGVQIKAAAEDSSTGDSGNIIVKAKDIVFADGANLGSDTYASGKAGKVDIYATGTITITGADLDGFRSMISSVSYPSSGIKGGDGGNIMIETNQLIVKDGGSISTSSISSDDIQSGLAGNITIHVQGSVELSGVNLYGENEDGFGSGIYTRSKGTKADDAGNIVLEAGSLTIKDGAVIVSSTDNNAKGGNINIDVSGPITITGDASHIQLNDPAFSQEYYEEIFSLTQINQSTSRISASSTSKTEGGDAGTITISAGDGIRLSNGGEITTEAVSAGGGQITINTDKVLRLTDSKVTSTVQEGAGNGGDIAINPKFIILDNGKIIAKANEGRGGNMNITTTGIYEFPPKLEKPIDASSKLGIDGEITVNSPDTDVSGALLGLPAEFNDASSQMPTPCDAKLAENLSSFVRVPSKSVVNAPNDLLSGGATLLKPLPLEPQKPTKNVTTKHSISTVAQMIDCRFKLSTPAHTIEEPEPQKPQMKKTSMFFEPQLF